MISVVIPVYNEAPNLERLIDRMEVSLSGLDEKEDYEIIFVDDGSTDRSLEILKSLSDKKRVRVIELIRNCGQHAAICAGFEYVKGDIIVTLDADLQNPPEEIPRLVREMKAGDWDVVGTIRENRQDSILRLIPSKIVNIVASRITGVHFSDWGCMLRAYKRSVVDAVVKCHERSAFIPAQATIFAKRITEIKIGHETRQAGRSKYNLLRLINLQFDLVTSFTDLPLRLLLYSGIALAFLGVVFGGLLGILRLYLGPEWAAEGVFTLFAVLFFFVGAQFFAFGLIGEYIGRIFKEVKKRPSYAVRKVYGD